MAAYFAAGISAVLLMKSAFIFLPGLVIIFWMLLNNTIPAWKETNKYCYTLLKNFEPYIHQDKIYILNLPSYYNGIAAFRTGFLESIYFKYYKDIPKKNITIVSHSYMNASVDSISVFRKNSKGFAVSVPKRKKPYFGSGGGSAKSYNTNSFTVNFDSSKCAYLLSFRDSVPKNAIILSISGTTWKKMKL